MGIPTKVVGGGEASTAQNVFKITFSTALSTAPRLKAFDNYALNTVAHDCFVGTTGNGSKPMMAAVGTTDSAPSANWHPSSATAGGATINLLKGDVNYVNLSASAPGAGASVLYNLSWEIPFDLPIAPSNIACVFFCEFDYSGSAPVLTWYCNDDAGGGTEGTPVWTQLTAGDGGTLVRPADAGVSSSNIVINRPVAGTIKSAEIWVH